MNGWILGGAEMMRLQAAWSRMAFATGEVVLRRSLMIAQGAMSATETTRMIMEKPAAFTDAALKATAAAVGGASPVRIVEASLRPISRSARSNARRLSR